MLIPIIIASLRRVFRSAVSVNFDAALGANKLSIGMTTHPWFFLRGPAFTQPGASDRIKGIL